MPKRDIIEGEPKLVVPGVRDFEEAGFDSFHRRAVEPREFGGQLKVRRDALGFDLKELDGSIQGTKIGYIHTERTSILTNSPSGMTLAASGKNWIMFRRWPADHLKGKRVFALPLTGVFVDADNVAGYNYPRGSQITGDRLGLAIITWHDLTESEATPDNAKGGLVVFHDLMNFGSASHTYYIYNRYRMIPLGSGAE